MTRKREVTHPPSSILSKIFFPQQKEGEGNKASSYLHIDQSLDAQISKHVINICHKGPIRGNF